MVKPLVGCISRSRRRLPIGQSSYLLSSGFGDSPAASGEFFAATFRCDWATGRLRDIQTLILLRETGGLPVGIQPSIYRESTSQNGQSWGTRFSETHSNSGTLTGKILINLNKLPQNSNAVSPQKNANNISVNTCAMVKTPWIAGIYRVWSSIPSWESLHILTMRTHAWDKWSTRTVRHSIDLRWSTKMTKDAETSRSHATKKWCNVFGMSETWQNHLRHLEGGAQAPGAPRRRQNPTRNGYRLYKWFLQMNRQWVIGSGWPPRSLKKNKPIPIGSMVLVYMLTFTINTPQMLAYIPAPWILWDRNQTRMSDFMQETAGILLHDSGTWMKFHQDQRIRSDPPRISLCYARTYVILCYLMLLSKKGRESKKKTSNIKPSPKKMGPEDSAGA